VTPSFQIFQLAAHYFVVNWASDQNNYIATVMAEIRVTVVFGAAIKVTASKLAE